VFTQKIINPQKNIAVKADEKDFSNISGRQRRIQFQTICWDCRIIHFVWDNGPQFIVTPRHRAIQRIG
jgi:hypothetical protein